ncbi:MAG: BspA family leucine-rich repeat surface protein, partial [Ekhidna sp.]|nr:BspA family leucine-rich repeat surface protein [Ekhidna sp.]
PPPPPNSLILSLKSTFFIISALFLALFGRAQDNPKPFITTWQTTSEKETITIPTTGAGYSYTVNWGEDEPADNNTYKGDASHEYATADTHTVTISGTFPRIYFSKNSTSARQIRTIQKWGDNPWTSMSNAFRSCTKLTIADKAGIPDLSNVTDMFAMFAVASVSGDLSDWDVSKVTNMNNMFTDNTSMSSENYDKLLIGWSTLDTDAGETKIPSGITFNAPDKYSCRGKVGRDVLTGEPYNWNISDDELISIRTEAAALQEVTSQCIASLTPPTAKSSCTVGGGTKVTAAHDVSNFPITESTLVTWTYTHNSKSIVQTQTVTITEDTTPPTVSGSLAAVTEQCPISAETDLTKPDAPADNCGGTVNVAIKSGTTFPLTESGTITWIYTDGAGNASEQTQEVTIDDTMPPEVTGDLPEVTSQCPLGAENELTEPDAPADNCKGTVSVALKSGTPFPIQAGTTTITWVYTDEAGNTSEQTQDVTIADTESPTVTDLNAITAACSLAEADLPEPTATDNCDEGQIMGAHNVTNFPITSNTSITWTFTDNADNTATQMQDVIVDNTPPTVSGNLNAITAQCQVTEAEVNAAAGSDTCPGEVTVTHNIPNDAFPITADRTITWTHTDAAGNTATQMQKVTIADTEAPRVTGTLDAITAACSLEEADVTVPTATDNCDGTVTAETDAAFPIMESETITWTYTDNAGNAATQTQEVTITPCVLSAAGDAGKAVIFPNPSGRYVEVQSPVETPIRILSVGGELVLESTTNARIDAASLHSGLYLIQLPDGRLLKFVKK